MPDEELDLLTPLEKEEDEEEGTEENKDVDESEDESDESKDKDSDEDSDEDSEDKDSEEEKETGDEEKTALADQGLRPSVKDITTEFPEFFKKFPGMRDMYFREAKYAEVFPSIEDATEAADRLQSLQMLEDSIFSGRPEGLAGLFSAIEDGKQGALAKFATNFLPALEQTHKESFFAAVTPHIQNVLSGVFAEGTNKNDEQLKLASRYVARAVFGNEDFLTNGNRNARSPERDSFDAEKQEFYEGKHNELRVDVSSTLSQSLESDIKKGLDPKGVLSDYLTKSLVSTIIQDVTMELEKDTRHMDRMNAIWERAKNAGFSGSWKGRLISTYLPRAKALLPGAIKRAAKEAFAGVSKSSSDKLTNAKKGADRRDVSPSGKGKSDSSPQLGKVDYEKYTDEQLLEM